VCRAAQLTRESTNPAALSAREYFCVIRTRAALVTNKRARDAGNKKRGPAAPVTMGCGWANRKITERVNENRHRPLFSDRKRTVRRPAGANVFRGRSKSDGSFVPRERCRARQNNCPRKLIAASDRPKASISRSLRGTTARIGSFGDARCRFRTRGSGLIPLLRQSRKMTSNARASRTCHATPNGSTVVLARRMPSDIINSSSSRWIASDRSSRYASRGISRAEDDTSTPQVSQVLPRKPVSLSRSPRFFPPGQLCARRRTKVARSGSRAHPVGRY